MNNSYRYMRLWMFLLGILMLGCQPITQTDSAGLTPSPSARATPPVAVAPQLPRQQLPITAQVVIEDQRIDLEVANSQAEQNLGLMG
ncbi:MAG: hypothetical protein HC792_03450, partial [Acaryochloridaceae cyanobacterium CSU_5_19]|nr:hypothetical protein [Acaryochloridaceae cyanobacterium CSU_5_19]